MIALIQRVSHARVDIDGECVGQIGKGLLVLLGVERNDDSDKADKLADKVLNYRIFTDEEGKMNLNVQQAGGQLLVEWRKLCKTIRMNFYPEYMMI